MNLQESGEGAVVQGAKILYRYTKHVKLYFTEALARLLGSGLILITRALLPRGHDGRGRIIYV